MAMGLSYEDPTSSQRSYIGEKRIHDACLHDYECIKLEDYQSHKGFSAQLLSAIFSCKIGFKPNS